jgi:hypothetical protein
MNNFNSRLTDREPEDYGGSITFADLGYPSSMLYDNSIVSTCESSVLLLFSILLKLA